MLMWHAACISGVAEQPDSISSFFLLLLLLPLLWLQ
jgi:hypothetical protein